MRGHNFTTCSICGRDYVCGDCITSGCELGHDKRKCEHYQRHIRQQVASGNRLLELARDSKGDKRKSGVARLLAGHTWDEIVKELTNSELAEAIKLKVWANMELGTEEISLVEQAIDRLCELQTQTSR